MLALAVAGAIAGFAVYSGGREGGQRETESDSISPPGSIVLTWVRSGEIYRIQKGCGFIRARGRKVAVDVAEGRFPLTCSAARTVMSRYLARPFVLHGTVRQGRLTFECRTSRPDGVGWDYHCSYSRYTAAGVDYVDVGAGRRPYR